MNIKFIGFMLTIGIFIMRFVIVFFVILFVLKIIQIEKKFKETGKKN